MTPLEAFRSRFLYRTLDAAVTAPLRPRRRLAAQLRDVVDPRVANYDRAAALVNAAEAVLPGAVRRAVAPLVRPVRLPGSETAASLLAYGSGSTVFLQESSAGRRVIKIYRRSLGRGRRGIERLLAEYRDKYEQARAWYAGVPELVWPAEFMVLPGHVLGRPAVASVQAFIEEPACDPLQELPPADLDALLSAQPALRAHFAAFAERTLRIHEETGRFPDLLGTGNLRLARRGNRYHLHLIDYGILDPAGAGRRTSARARRIEACLARLRELSVGTGGSPADTTPGEGERCNSVPSIG